jgi:hypothetical protein
MNAEVFSELGKDIDDKIRDDIIEYFEKYRVRPTTSLKFF